MQKLNSFLFYFRQAVLLLQTILSLCTARMNTVLEATGFWNALHSRNGLDMLIFAVGCLAR